MKNPELKEKIEKVDYAVDYKTPSQFKKLLEEEYKTADAIALKIGLRK